jgi:hypothetical protein
LNIHFGQSPMRFNPIKFANNTAAGSSQASVKEFEPADIVHFDATAGKYYYSEHLHTKNTRAQYPSTPDKRSRLFDTKDEAVQEAEKFMAAQKKGN